MKFHPALFLLSLLTACAVPPDHEACANLLGASLCLQDSGGVKAFTALQSATLHFNGTSETLILQLENDAQGLRLAGLTPIGQPLIQASFLNGQFTASGPAAERFDARLLLATIQAAWWPLPQLQAAYQTNGLRMQESVSPHERRLMHDNDILLTIRYGSGHDLQMEMTGLRLDVSTLEWQE